MKKILAVLAVFSVLFSLASCKLSPQMSEEDLRESLTAEASKKVEESIKAQEEYEENVGDSIDEIGKTVKNKKLVIKVNTSLGKEYMVYHFGKDKKVDYRVDHFFYDSIENYEWRLNDKADGNKVIAHDESMKMVAVKLSNVPEDDFEYLYNTYTDEKIMKYGYEVIE